MKARDYKCTKCENTTELWIKDTESFPETIKCDICGENSKKVFSIVGTIIHRGKCGNAKNGYESSPVSIKKS